MIQIEVNGQVRQFVDGPVTIGRSPACDVVVEGDGVSREHLRVVSIRDRWTITDVSTHGSYTSDGERINKDFALQEMPVHVHLGAPGGTSVRISVPHQASTHAHEPQGKTGTTTAYREESAQPAEPMAMLTIDAIRDSRARLHRRVSIAVAIMIPLMIWSIQVYEVSVRLDGFNGVAGRASNVIPGYPEARQISGFLFWFLVSSSLSAAIVTLATSGPATYVERVRTHSLIGIDTLRFLISRQDRRFVIVVATALLVTVIAPALVLPPLAIATLLSLVLLPSSDAGFEIRRRLRMNWSGGASFTPHRVMLAIAVMAILGVLVPTRPRAALAAAGFLLAILLRHRSKGGVRFGDIAMLALAAIAVLAGDATAVLADDGGWSECVGGAGALGGLSDWWSCAGSQAIRDAARDGAATAGALPPALQSFFPYSCPDHRPPQPYGPGHPDYPEPKFEASPYLPSDFEDPRLISDKLDDLRAKKKKTENLIDKTLDLIKNMLAAPGKESDQINREVQRHRRELEQLERSRRESERQIQHQKNRYRQMEAAERNAPRQRQKDEIRARRRSQRRRQLRRSARRVPSDARLKLLRREL